MSVRKNYSCDLCGFAISETDGIGILHQANGDIEAVWLHKEGAGRHLCNRCVKGLRVMLAGLDRTNQIHDELDRSDNQHSDGGRGPHPTPEGQRS